VYESFFWSLEIISERALLLKFPTYRPFVLVAKFYADEDESGPLVE
jgi:hypothetical protein